jgi:hypothetical protein
MSKVSGILVENISKISGVPAVSIRFIGPINTLNLPNWPGNDPPSCVDLSYQFGTIPGIACSESSGLYSFNTITQQLFQFGYCDDILNYASEGFYVDTFGNIYNWQETTMGWTWSFFGSCIPTPTCDDKSLSYGEAPGVACNGSASFYSFDSTNNLLYPYGGCGGDYAPEGFYVDGTMIYRWYIDGRVWLWEPIGPCV